MPIWRPPTTPFPHPKFRAVLHHSSVRARGHDLAARTRPERAGWLFTTGGVIVLIFTLMVIAGLTWGAGRINAHDTTPGSRTRKRRIVPLTGSVIVTKTIRAALVIVAAAP
ncbi:hypothetical protein I553_4067 [Mycobacterium xenopi 4042]|uniref:Uncharacterized protein n=1 Tax=Mycobacterium xenopi 4042 TaxID=1299334 RepID=X7Z1N9_MYCXE|nr:hypothetical protein I553_4067 [Mycobacterium xenopi 4042]